MRDMYRTDWTRITEREYFSRACDVHGRPGRESLIVIRDITEPLTVSSAGQPVKIVERDYSWLQVAAEGEPVWLTAMFDETGKLLQMYFDITAGNCFINPENPTFRDMYLDVVLRPDGKVMLLDQEELDEALAKGEITSAEHDGAQAAADTLCRFLREHTQEVLSACKRRYEALRYLL